MGLYGSGSLPICRAHEHFVLQNNGVSFVIRGFMLEFHHFPFTAMGTACNLHIVVQDCTGAIKPCTRPSRKCVASSAYFALSSG